MSTLRVTLERLTIHPHPNADLLELAQVGLYRAVVLKGQFDTGDLGLYIPEQAILPDDLIETLGLTGKLSGKQHNRVKAVRLRGEISQGVVADPFELDLGLTGFEIGEAFAEGRDFATQLGITKWFPEIPAQMAGQAISGVDLIRWIEIENLQRYPNIFEPGEMVVLTEKIHGTCLIATLTRDGELLVSSKGLAHNGIALAENYENLYWRAVRQYGLREVLREILDAGQSAKVAIYGEVYGRGVQDLHYGANVGHDETIGFRVFDIRIEESDGKRWWVDSIVLAGVCAVHGLKMVPVLHTGPFDVDVVREHASGKTTIGGDHIREGVVIRPLIERHSDVLGGRAIAKYVSPDYLTRTGGTEYE